MSKIFKEYGGVVTVVVAIVALIGLVVFLMTDTGVMANAFGNITGQFVEKSEQLIEDVGSIDGNGGAGEPGGSGGVELPAVGTSAEDCTWEQIKAIGDAGKADEYFDLGDTKTITLTDDTKVVMQMVAFNADTKADGSGKAAITWISKDLVAKHVMNTGHTNAGGWEASEMRSWLQGEFYATLTAEVKENIVTVTKTYGDYNGGSYVTKECNDNVWIPSQYEMFGANSTTYGCEDSGVAYTDYFESNTLRTKEYGGNPTYWWLRSANSGDSGSFRDVTSSGGSGSRTGPLSYGVALGFCT